MMIDHKSRISAISEFIRSNRQNILDNLKYVVSINSPSEFAEGNDSVGEFLLSLLCDLDIKANKFDGDPFGQHIVVDSCRKFAPNLLFCGHMDTVFPLGTEWPFRIANGRAFGPGVIDMKSGIIALIYALRALHFTGGIPAGFRILLNSDEEQGSINSRRLLPELLKDIDFAFILEPAEPDGKVIIKRKGIGKFEISVTGLAAHAGKSPETGINAILEIAHKIVAAENLARKKKGTTINTGVVNGGQSAFIVAESARAVIEGRVWSVVEQARIESGMKNLANKSSVKGAKISVGGGFHRPPLMYLPEAKILIDSVKSASKELGMKVQFGGSGAASDGNNISSFGIPVIDGMGPVGGREHSHDEYLEVESLFERTELLAGTILHLARLYGS